MRKRTQIQCSTRGILAAILVITSAAQLVKGQCSETVHLYATEIPAVCGWDYEDQATGPAGGAATSFCDETSFPYAIQSKAAWSQSVDACSIDFSSCSCGNLEDCECFLEATQHTSYVKPAGMAIKKVLVDVQARYDHANSGSNPDPGSIRLKVALPSRGSHTTLDSGSFSNSGSDGDCKYRFGDAGDITNAAELGVQTWTQGLINELQVGVRRLKDGRNTPLRVNAFRITVVHCADANGDNQCDTCGDGFVTAVCGEQCDGGPCCDGSCRFLASGSTCPDDGNYCTSDVCNGAGACSHANKANGNACGDGAQTACSDPDTCVDGTCRPNHKTPGTVCGNDNNPCTSDYCDNVGACIHPAKTDGTGCDDGLFCTVGDSCVSGNCRGASKTCPSDECNAGSCNESANRCDLQRLPDGTPCGDGSTVECSDPDTCKAGLCDPNDVPDGELCGTDECDACEEGSCLPIAKPVCGDGQCGCGEDCSTCPQDCSQNGPIIIIDEWCVTGVPNKVLPDGLTMSDYICKCAAEADTHGKFVSCVARAAASWKRSGLLGSGDTGRIVRCAAKADIPANIDAKMDSGRDPIDR